MSTEKHGFPAFLSLLIPGLGQLIKGQIARGIGILAGAVALPIVATIVASFKVYPVVVILAAGGIVGWIWQIADAYNHNSR